MISGKTKSGFEFTCDKEILDDWDFLEALTAGTAKEEIRAARMLLGDEQLAQLKEHVRSTGGRASFSAMDRELGEIIQAVTGKN